MSAATASIADVSRTDLTNRDDRRERNSAGQSQAQCTPIPLPALGTQRITQGNGTNVGTVIRLQCPDRHKLVGKELMCVMDTNSTHWVGETYCRPLSPFEDHGFRVAMLASIVSSAIIFLMSMAFITCCLVDCIKEDKRRKQERESDLWQWDEQAQNLEDNRSRFGHKSRNNNNNNSQDKGLSLWDSSLPPLTDNTHICRCHQQYAYVPSRTFGRTTTPLSALPGQDYERPLLPPHIPESVQMCGPPLYATSAQSSSPTVSLARLSAARPASVWQYGGQQNSFNGARPSSTRDESSSRNTNPAKEFPIRVISV